LEAMACHCPVVTTNVNGINEVVKDGINGLMCEYGDVENFSKNLKLALTNHSLTNDLIVGGTRSLETTFNSDIQAIKHIEIYSELANINAKILSNR